METKYYRFGMSFYKIMSAEFERVTAYHHNIGIDVQGSFLPDMEDLTEITKAQYDRIRKVIILKLMQNV